MVISQFSQSTLHHATVVEKNDNLFYVTIDNKVLIAKRAFSCLIEPDNGDIILLSTNGSNVFILAVLERNHSADAVLSSNGNLQIQLPCGDLSLQSKSIQFDTCTKFSINSPTVSVDTVEAEMKFAELSLIGKSVQCFIDIIKTVGEKAESFFKKIFLYAEHSHHQIDNTETINCNNLIYNAENLMQLRGKLTQISSKQDVHIKGERVHLG